MSDFYAPTQVKNLLDQKQSFSGDAWVTTDYASDGIAKGQGFEISYRVSIPAGADRDIWINYAAYDNVPEGNDGIVAILPPVFACLGGSAFVDVYREPTITSNGTSIRIIRKNTTIDNFPQVEWWYQPTVSDVGSDPFQYLVSGNGISTGGTNLPFFRGNTSSTLVRINNPGGSAITFYYGQVWFEI